MFILCFINALECGGGFIPIRTHTVKHIFLDILLTFRFFVDICDSMCYDIGGTMYTMRDKIIDGVTGVLLGAAFILLCVTASVIEVSVTGM